MAPSMKCSMPRLLLLVLALGFRATAQDQDLTIKTLTGPLIVSGSPTLAIAPADTTQTHLQTGPMDTGKTQYLVLYGLDNNPTGNCALDPTWTVHVGMTPANGALTVTLGPTLMVTSNVYVPNTTTGTLSNVPGLPGYAAWQLIGYSPDGYFSVTDAMNRPVCGGLGTDYSKHFLRISTESAAVITQNGKLDPGDVPIPIVGSSLKLYAPGASSFSCTGDHQSAELEITGNVTRLDTTHPKYPDPRTEPYVSLSGISDWKITAYPQGLQIKHSFFGSKLLFSVPAPRKLDCNKDINGYFLDVLNPVNSDTTRPQELIVDWSQSWFEPRRYLTVPCVNCYLLLVTNPH